MKLDPKALERAAFACFARANKDKLKPETIEKLWPSQSRPHWGGLAEATITAYLTAIGETHVLVPRTDLEQVVEVANRNEQSPEGDRLAALLAAAKEGE